MKKWLSILLALTMALMAVSACAQSFDEEHELLIIGGGAAGLSAAIEAADLGAQDVLVVEKLGYVGGSAFVSAGILGGWIRRLPRLRASRLIPWPSMLRIWRRRIIRLILR